ncbi:Uncharacterized conserved protein [Legionella londiniensis]|uniref:UvrD/REP helicase n=1 Tax=Legionella londiniensis TaxID=45068 RepID=A0A0W0VLK6_9GAMM|nr:UvrD-helicase domain-containing protein [Legionella londiniensis]KTD21019.1 UvrD/REP helicase [Legionella londiniensis]STX93706.1 Uncharacterized conserved protein [Legionella londiniensis]
MPEINSNSETCQNTVFYWDNYLDPQKILSGKHQEQIQKVVGQLLSGCTSSADLDLKRSKKYKIYGARLNQSDRLLFTTVKIEGKSHLLILDIIENHDYQKSWVFKKQAITAFMGQDFTSLKQKEINSEAEFEACENPIPLSSAQAKQQSFKPLFGHRYHGEFIKLTSVQEAALQAGFPLLVRGAAGSGKSCVAFALLEKWLNLLTNAQTPNNHKSRLLFVAKSKLLVENFKTLFNKNNVNPELVFKTYDELARDIDESLKNKKLVGQSGFTAWLSGSQNKSIFKSLGILQLPSDILPEILYKEFKIIAALPDYQLSIYLNLGLRQSRIDKNTRKLVLDLFAVYNKYLNQNSLVDLSFYNLNTSSISQFDLVVVDESQDLSRVQLSSLQKIAWGNQICYCMDTNQALEDVLSDVSFIESLFQEPIHKFDLNQSYRVSPQVASFANKVLKIKNLLCEGVLSRGEYAQFEIEPNSRAGTVEWHSIKQAKNFEAMTAKPNTAVVIPNETLKEKAREALATPLIFTASQIKGLEYENVILYWPFANPTYKEINILLQKKRDSGDKTSSFQTKSSHSRTRANSH